ncbi:MAG TPA: hypothetical protein VGQ57_21395 [Polyangiaceae bacterium]|nr:hypothetical protein [Polyangiaceae bacterium]
MARPKWMAEVVVLWAVGCSSNAKVDHRLGDHGGSGAGASAGSLSAGGNPSGNTSGGGTTTTGGHGNVPGDSGRPNGGRSGTSNGSSGDTGGGGESGDAGNGGTSDSGGAAGKNTAGNGGASAAAGSGATAGAGGAAGSGPCGPLSAPCPATTVVHLSAGGGAVCALFASGNVKCWGSNLYGHLGYGNTKNIGDDELPSAVGTVSLSKSAGVVAQQLSVGLTHTCALLSDGTVKCWGRSAFGELGYGSTDNVGDDELPSDVTPVSVTTTPGISVTQLSAGGTHTCALLSDGTIKCWGQGDYGQLGYADGDDLGDDELPSDRPAVSVSTTPGVTVTQVSAGFSHTCALLSDGTVKCWGANQDGQLGRGTPNNLHDDELPSEVDPIPLTNTPGVIATAIQAGNTTSCALLSDGSVKCWGSAEEELVGTGLTGPVLDPSSVGPIGVSTNPALSVTEIALGNLHACVRLSDGACTCWGNSAYGQLGYGNTDTIGDDELPSSAGTVEVTTGSGVTVAEIVTGSSFTCALLSDDAVKCWGDNGGGELGNGKIDGYAVGDDELPSSVGPVKLL